MEKKRNWKKASWRLFSGLLISFNGVALFLVTYHDYGIDAGRTWMIGILCLLCLIDGVIDFCRGISLLRDGDKTKEE